MPKFECVTTAQVERTYLVDADDEEQAGKRLRTFMKDPELLREGIVEKLDKDENSTPERIKNVSQQRAQAQPKLAAAEAT